MYPDEDEFGIIPHRSEVIFTILVIIGFVLLLALAG